jgi:hypothetical protein
MRKSKNKFFIVFCFINNVLSYISRYVKCHDEPVVHKIELQHESGKSHESIHGILLVGLKYLLGGLLLLTLPFVIAKAVILPLKFFIGLKIIAMANTFLFGYYLVKFLKRWIRFVPAPVPVLPTHGFLKSNQKLETIKEILDQDKFEDDVEEDSLEDQESRIDDPTTVEQAYEEDLIKDLIKLIKKKNKNW